MIVRLALAADADALAALHRRSASAGFTRIFSPSQMSVGHVEMAADWSALLRVREQPGPTTYVVEVGADVVGVIIATVDSVDPTIGRIGRMYVDPKYWNGGVAPRLLDASVSYLRDRGCRVALAWIMEPNTRARRTVERLGARPTGARQPTCERAASSAVEVEDLEYELLIDPIRMR